MKGWCRWAGTLLLAVTKLAIAASFSISPLGLSIPSRDSSASIVAQNTGSASVVIQVKAMAWRQSDGKDVRDDTRDLVVNPPLFKLGPGEQQLVRIASRSGPPADVERAYRVVFTEVPPPAALRTESGFRLALAMDIPVYIEPATRANPTTVRWQAERVDGGVRVTAENLGNVHNRFVEAEFAAASRILQKTGVIVVLPRSSRAFDLPAVPPGTTAIYLSAEDDARAPVSVEIPLPPAR
jgi:fimbrial chaperone protein